MSDVNSTMTQEPKGHPRGLYLLFFTEMWERFSYYGMRAIFILFLTKAMMMSDAEGSNIYGSFTGLVYLTPLLGGYLCDKFLGNRRSIFIGGILMAIGQFLLFFSASSLESKGLSYTLMWAGLTTLIIGNGFFKPNISTMVGQLYEKGDRRVDAAFTIFYMGINLGAFFSPLICGGLAETGNIHDFKWGFLAAGIGMVISVISFEVMKNKYLIGTNGQQIGMPVTKLDMKNFGIIIGSILLIFFLLGFKSFFNSSLDLVGYLIYGAMVIVPTVILSDKSLTKEERSRILVIFILAFFVIFFWSAFEQAGASLTIFADKNIDRGVNISVSKYLILAFGVVLTYFLSKALTWFFEWKKSMIYIITGIASAILVFLTFTGHLTDFVKNEFPASWFQSVNPLAVITMAPLFSMFWGFLHKRHLEPASPLKMAWGLALLCLGYIIIAYAVNGLSPTAKTSMIWLFALYIVHSMGELCLSPIGLSMVSKLAPVRFASLLMGTWFLANAAANKFAGTLSALIPPSANAEGSTASVTQFPSIFGFQITNLFEFFMVFIIMSGTAALILFLISGKLGKMMFGIK